MSAVAHRPLARQVGRYLSVAICAQLANLACFVALRAAGTPYLLAGAAGFLTAFSINFVFNRAWTFGVGHLPHGRQLLRFTITNAVSIAVGLLALHVLVVAAGLPPLVAQIGATGAGMPPNFLGQKFWAFRA